MPAGENQRALDRISYLGGILIPLPIISGILSMEDAYGPGGNKFFVFWAVSIPLALLTVMVIYADTIRTAEVWIETPADRVVPSNENSSNNSSNSSNVNISPIGGEAKRCGTVTWTRHQPNGHDEQVSPSARPEDMAFPFDHDTEERIIGMPMAAQPPDDKVTDAMLDLLPGPDRWGLGMVPVPMIVLECPADGKKPKAWKRQELGWYGAIRAIVYKRPRDGRDIPMGVPACEKGGRPKAQSY